MNGKHTILGDLDFLAKIPRLAVDLHSVMKELLKVAAVKDTIVCGFGEVNEEFVLRCGALRGSPRL